MLPFLALCTVLCKLAAAGPCDIYAQGGTPCVAAHSTVRSLYDSFGGALYQVFRNSDNSTKDIYPLSTGGVANAGAQDYFCNSGTCLITIIYDQSGNGNHLTAAPPGGAASGAGSNGYDFTAGATGAAVTVGGNRAYGVFSSPGTGYRNDNTKNIATGNEPEGLYAIFDGTHYNGNCCYDYGNAETDNHDDGSGTMESIYFGNNGCCGGNTLGEGNGPWIMGDLENGLWAGGSTSNNVNANNPPIDYRFVTAVVKGNDTNQWAIRGGNSQTGPLSTFWSGPRPNDYYPMRKQGAGLGG